MALKIKKLILKPKKLVLIVSPKNFTLLEIKTAKKWVKIINKIEKSENFFYESTIIKERVEEFLKLLQDNYYGQQINVVFNLPKFFIQKFTLPNLEKIKESNIIENKIKEEFPINLDRYFWKVHLNPNNYENIMVIFYEKEILETIINQLFSSNFLPIELQPIFSPILSFIKEKYALAYDKSYLIFNILNGVITIIVYENGFVTNIFSEEIEGSNKEEIIERIINSSLRNITTPLDIIFVIRDEEIDLNFITSQNLKIIDIKKEINLSPIEISAYPLFNYLNKNFLSEFSLNVYNLEKDITLYNLNNILRLWLLISLVIGIIINGSLGILLNYFKKEKFKIDNEISKLKLSSNLSSDYNLENIKNIITNLKNRNLQLRIYRDLEILKYLKNYKIILIESNNKSTQITIEENDSKKRDLILNYLKNELKLDNIRMEDNLIKISINNE